MPIFQSCPTSVLELLTAAEQNLNDRRIDSALRLVHDFVERIVTEPLCSAQVFSSKDLDALCQRIGHVNLQRKSRATFDPWPARGARRLVIYIVSRLQKSGGHSRVVLDFITAQPECDHLILLTGVGGSSDHEFLTQIQSGNFDNLRIQSAPRGSFELRLDWLQAALNGSRCDHVYLFNHHQDSVAVAAAQPSMGLNVSFYHHGDHHLCLGVHLKDVAHIDPHPMGYHHCRSSLGIENIYLPLTFEDKGVRSPLLRFCQNGWITTATAARSNKVEIPYFVSYVDLIPKLLKRTGGRHVHIGRLTPWALIRIRYGLQREGISPDRFVYIAWTSSVWRALQEHKVDVYLASFPYGGGITLIEAMGAGIPVILHRHIYSRVLSGLELAYQEAFSWRFPEELLSKISTLRPDDLINESVLARSRYESFHRPEILRACLKSSEVGIVKIPPLHDNFDVRQDEWAAWATGQLSLRHLFSRTSYRFARNIRTFFSG